MVDILSALERIRSAIDSTSVKYVYLQWVFSLVQLPPAFGSQLPCSLDEIASYCYWRVFVNVNHFLAGKQIFIGSQHKGRGNRVQFIETLLTQLAGAFDVITADVYWGLNVIRCWFSTADAEFYFHFYVQILSGFTSRISLGGICTPFFNKRIFSLDPFNASL